MILNRTVKKIYKKKKNDVSLDDLNYALQGRGYEIAELLGAKRGVGNGIYHCVAPGHIDKNASMKIDNATGLAHCFSCGAGFNLISMAKALGHDKAFPLLCKIVGIGGKK